MLVRGLFSLGFSIYKNNQIEMNGKEFYGLKELTTITKLHYRQLQERVKIVSKKYEGRIELIYKKSNKWYIHKSIVSEFDNKRFIDYKLFITIASKNSYDLNCWKKIMNDLNNELKKIDASTRIKYVIENNKSGVLHLHFITSFKDTKKLQKVISTNYMTSFSNQMNSKIIPITNLTNLNEYLKKQSKQVIIRK